MNRKLKAMLKLISFLLLLSSCHCTSNSGTNWLCLINKVKDEGNGTTIAVRSVPQGLHTNCIWHPIEGGMVNGKHFWEYKFATGVGSTGAFVGATTDDYLKPNVAVKGMFYGGNLVSGQSAVRDSFGPFIAAGDTVRLLFDITNKTLNMFVYHNNVFLGHGFKIKAPFPTPLFPALITFKNCEVTIKKISEIPSVKEKKANGTGVVGYWKVDEVELNVTSFAKGGFKKYALEINETSPNAYRLHFQVMSQFEAQLSQNGNDWSFREPIITKKITRNKNVKKFEAFVENLLKNFKTLEVNEESLTLFANNGDKIEFRRVIKGLREPVLNSPFD